VIILFLRITMDILTAVAIEFLATVIVNVSIYWENLIL